MNTPILHTGVIKPPRIKQGDKIGIISPAGPVDEARLLSSLEMLESSGFQPQLGVHVRAKKGYLAGNDEERLEDLHWMFLNQEIAAIFCTRGGYGSLRLLDKISYDTIRQHPKAFVGYSDITALLMNMYERSNLVTFHGPMVCELAVQPRRNWEDLLAVLTGTHPLKIRLSGGRTLGSGFARGKLLGGNLSMICHLAGTPFLPSLDGSILFLEETGEPLYRLDRMLTSLKMAGKLGRLAGIVSGRFGKCADASMVDALLMERLKDIEIPIATGLPIGHGPANTTLPLGLSAELDTEKMTLSIEEPCVV